MLCSYKLEIKKYFAHEKKIKISASTAVVQSNTSKKFLGNDLHSYAMLLHYIIFIFHHYRQKNIVFNVYISVSIRRKNVVSRKKEKYLC